jgi:RNA polymerase sigma-70 factor (ECF subfamily)
MREVRKKSLNHNDVEASFKRIYAQELRYVWNCLRRLGVDERDLEDKVHDVFVVFFRRFQDYDDTRPVRPWLGGIATRVASDHHRMAYKKREVLKDQMETKGFDLGPEAAMGRSDARRLVMQALDTLDFKHRSVFVLHDIEGHSMPEIADMLSSPLNTLYSRLRFAREKFTTSVRRLGLKGGGI